MAEEARKPGIGHWAPFLKKLSVAVVACVMNGILEGGTLLRGLKRSKVVVKGGGAQLYF